MQVDDNVIMPATGMVETAVASINAAMSPVDTLPLWSAMIQSPLFIKLTKHIKVGCRICTLDGRVELCSQQGIPSATSNTHFSAATGKMLVCL
jgi:hypothetical protein